VFGSKGMIEQASVVEPRVSVLNKDVNASND
jgi:hypothetical protein